MKMAVYLCAFYICNLCHMSPPRVGGYTQIAANEQKPSYISKEHKSLGKSLKCKGTVITASRQEQPHQKYIKDKCVLSGPGLSPGKRECRYREAIVSWIFLWHQLKGALVKAEKVKALLLARLEVLHLTVPHWFLILIPEMKHTLLPLLGRGQLNTDVKNDSTHVHIGCKSSLFLKRDQCFF